VFFPPPGRVVHCRVEPYDIYIGRPGPWGNPIRLLSESHREQCIAEYRAWLWAEIEAGRIGLWDLAALYGKTLGCWCAPRLCHGLVLLAAAKWAVTILTDIYGYSMEEVENRVNSS
jgi:hypothetical protein